MTSGRHGVLRGIRHLIHQEPDPDWLVRDDVQPGLDLLARRGLAFDVVAVFPDHLRLVPAVADRHPDLTFVHRPSGETALPLSRLGQLDRRTPERGRAPQRDGEAVRP